MLKRVLIAEDHELANISVQKSLNDFGIKEAKYVYYCDHALVWLKKAVLEKVPYDLLITDLGFEDDNTEQEIRHGLALIEAAKAIQPELKIIVLTAERLNSKIDNLLKLGQVNGFVRKARRDAYYLLEALYAVNENRQYISPENTQKYFGKNSYEFSKQDIAIISLLAEGVAQKNIPVYLQQRNIKPWGLSSIEKSLRQMKDILGVGKNEQLVAYCKDIGLI
ncbi:MULTISPECIES: response regulator [Sphingobacterium]|uniref:response regulator n=1 Tax=Sphingobacterium TaxID=28453 RepID=UPI0013D9FCA8|nr:MULTISPECIES: response regulator [unclassified Sphingobacterium]